MMFRRFALAAALLAPLALPVAASAGTVTDDTNVSISQTVAGINNFGQLDASHIANGGLFYNGGKGSVSRSKNVTIDQTVAGVDNTGFLSAHDIANGGTHIRRAPRLVLFPRD
jgi:hypothetical protein